MTLAVLGGVALLGLWVIRVGLRPLTEIGATAATIAAGDLSHRVAREDDRTEVGRLGRALNAMLAQIESAFQRPRGVRAEAAPLRRRRLARAAHAARRGSRLRRAVLARCRPAAGRPRAVDGRDHAGVRAHEPPRRGSAAARAARRGPAARARAGRAATTVVAESVETARMLEPERSIDCRLDRATVIGDRDRLRQVVDNLLSNVRAHADADASVEVTLERADDVVRLTVTDSGPGLDRRAGRARVRAVLPGRPLARTNGRRCRPRPLDRRGGDGRPRRAGDRIRRARRRRGVHDRAAARCELPARRSWLGSGDVRVGATEAARCATRRRAVGRRDCWPDVARATRPHVPRPPSRASSRSAPDCAARRASTRRSTRAV